MTIEFTEKFPCFVLKRGCCYQAVIGDTIRTDKLDLSNMKTDRKRDALMQEFRYIGYAQEIIFGPGSISRLGEAIERFGWRRLMLCSSASLRRDAIEEALGDRLISTFEHVQPHVPDVQVTEALTLAYENQVDALIGLGGGSPIGMAKAVSLTLEEKRRGQPARAAFPTDQPLVPVIAIPTTYAGSEMTPTYGVTHYIDGLTRKITVMDAKVTPKLTLY